MSDFIGSNLLRHRDEPKPMEHHFFDYWRNRFNDAGWRDAADNLDRYLGGTGAEKVYSEQQIEQMPPVMHRIGRNNTRVETLTFTGQTNNEVARRNLLSLRPGETTELKDSWDAPYSPKNMLGNAVKGTYGWLTRGDGTKLRSAYDDLRDTLAYPGTYAAIGSFPLKTVVDTRARRDGDKLFINGTVRHGFRDRIDFDPGQLADAPGQVLERQGLAAEFPIRYESTQDVEAEGEYGPGGITLKKVTWGKRR
jgi:hypothetical protein